MRAFFHALIFGTAETSQMDSFYFGYDRCKWSSWDYYAFYCGFFKVMVYAKKPI